MPDAIAGPTVGEVGEFGLIARVSARLPRGDATLLGPGDDAAVVAAPDGRVVATTDVLVEGVHFRRDWSTAEDVGRKAAAASLADVVAMGAVPTALLVALTTPPDLPVSWAEGLADGLAAACADCADETGGLAGVVGGDTTRSAVLTVAVTALGDLDGGPPLLRSGARPGDRVVLAGSTGWSAAGLALLVGGQVGDHVVDHVVDHVGGLLEGSPAARALLAHRRPRPAYADGLALVAAGATSLCDVSDGLVADLGHVAAASGVGIDLDPSLLVPDRGMVALGRVLSTDPTGWVLTGGEDHAFAGTLPDGVEAPAGSRVIGRVTAGSGVTVGGLRWAGTGGHRHF